MPAAKIVFYREADGSVPVSEWLDALQRRDRNAYAKCIAKLQRLSVFGRDLRRPDADYLRDGIHELRARAGTVNYRVLYFFYGGNICVLAHALTKRDRVPDADIERARRRKASFERAPEVHTYNE